jgi:hypothetical protein
VRLPNSSSSSNNNEGDIQTTPVLPSSSLIQQRTTQSVTNNRLNPAIVENILTSTAGRAAAMNPMTSSDSSWNCPPAAAVALNPMIQPRHLLVPNILSYPPLHDLAVANFLQSQRIQERYPLLLHTGRPTIDSTSTTYPSLPRVNSAFQLSFAVTHTDLVTLERWIAQQRNCNQELAIELMQLSRQQ